MVLCVGCSSSSVCMCRTFPMYIVLLYYLPLWSCNDGLVSDGLVKLFSTVSAVLLGVSVQGLFSFLAIQLGWRQVTGSGGRYRRFSPFCRFSFYFL